MKTLIDVFSLRPIWTRHGLEVVWYAYLLATLINLGFHVSFIYSAIASSINFPSTLTIETVSVLFALANLALVRIFLELALKFLITNWEEAHVPAPGRREKGPDAARAPS